jgi:DNA-binding protein H-NS
VSRRASGTEDEARELKARQKTQLGELVSATGADSLSAEELAGLLLAALEQANSAPQAREGRRRRGEAFFQRRNGATGGNGARPARLTAE